MSQYDEITAQTQVSGNVEAAFTAAMELAKRREIVDVFQVSLWGQDIETHGGGKEIVGWEVEVRGRVA